MGERERELCSMKIIENEREESERQESEVARPLA
jgi:hypothetical protein